MNLQELNNLVDDPGSVAWPVKAVAIAFLMGVIMFLGYKLVIADSVDELNGVERKEQELRQTLETKQKRASQLPQFKAQLEEMKHSFGVLLQQLPNSTEIPGLILDISEKGLANGLEIERFEPGEEIQKDFYAEKPIKIVAKGSYRELATFVSDISGLPRIVTIHNIDLQPEDAESKRLVLDATIKTYRYLDDDAVADTKKAQKGKAGGKAG